MNFLQKMARDAKKISKKLKPSAACNRFCYQDGIKTRRLIKQSAKRFHLPYQTPSKQAQERSRHICHKVYCNPTCQHFPYMQYKTRNGFATNYTPNQIETLKKHGAISGCLYDMDSKWT
jgi:hypothetical protein